MTTKDIPNLPLKVTINSLPWVVKFDSSLVDDFGSCDSNSRTISIGVLGTQALASRKMEIISTFIHELLHAHRDGLGLTLEDQFQDEHQVRVLEVTIMNFILTNKKQVRAILDMIDGLT